ncbi:gp274 [Sphingomonas phage PAU]|uniref:gp274 n=1 Tax=Sphingomonas phage PAU TaxID=1150991 RepID=UPI0002573418|nr:gp274 [Sphingomonas phage PAU]AFF28272.1 gp274 [Sphingomonas phage PAU]
MSLKGKTFVPYTNSRSFNYDLTGTNDLWLAGTVTLIPKESIIMEDEPTLIWTGFDFEPYILVLTEDNKPVLANICTVRDYIDVPFSKVMEDHEEFLDNFRNSDEDDETMY